MHSIPAARTILVALLATTAAGTLPAQSLDAQVATLLRQADGLPLSRAFELGIRASDLSDRPDPVRDSVVRLVEKEVTLGPKARLAAACALQGLTNDATYGKDILTILKPVSESENVQARAAAMAMFGEDRYFNRRIQPDVQKILERNTADELVPPQVRVEAATALWKIGSNAQKAIAKDTLTLFLRSQDRDLQIRGALALAEINTEPSGEGWRLLREIADEPTEQGRLARMYLNREKERRQFERLLGRLLNQRDAAPKDDDEFRVLQELKLRIRAQHIRGRDFTDLDLVEYAAKGMLQGLDRHSAFFTSDEFQRFYFDLNREYGGIGAFVNFDQEGDFSIVRPIYSGPAYDAGLRSGDKILEVDGWETGGRTSDEIISRLKGKPGTSLVIKMFRLGLLDPEDISIVREQIMVPSVNSTMVPGDIGYVELINFSANTALELRKSLRQLKAKGAKAIVLDVRYNTGGYLTAARDVVEQFLAGEKLVVYTEGRTEERRNYSTRDNAVSDLPLAVLVNGFSASASEIVAGALQDHGRAVIIGERSYGKGSVQNLVGLTSEPGEKFDDDNNNGIWDQGEQFDDDNGNGKYDVGPHLKLTVAKYYLPSGRCLHKEFDKEGKIIDPNWGVMPDTELELLETKPEEAWKNAAVFALFRQGAFRKYVREQMENHEQLFLELAEGDAGDWSRYPEFEEFYQSLETNLSKDDVRRWVRYRVRDEVADLRGKVYPGNRALGDPQEDAQLQEAARQLLTDLGIDIREIDSYKPVLKIPFDDGEEKPKEKVGATSKR